MRFVVALIAIAFSSVAFAGTSATVTGSAKHDFAEDKNKYAAGVAFSVFTKGIAYWTWNGYGQSAGEQWYSTQHGVDFSAGPLKLGPVVEYKIQEDENKLEIGLRSSIKLW